ncbi:hypothetical protein D0B54_04435 [Solimonas sp. K1W22B-7]|uniref:hypothetical protein n=1 Tax=Solimonas sp. K1W22B-7 TaxID=2303331 RepID=UPI000E332F87|nr:hypothetical protein [Solimonas sp. K1W22B-7]AXQ27968.1 hypothetical protein D0B54_04435 [Solimonas sp. K1W22B-7]
MIPIRADWGQIDENDLDANWALKQFLGKTFAQAEVMFFEEVVERNETFQSKEYCSGYLAIGNDSGGSAIVIPSTMPSALFSSSITAQRRQTTSHLQAPTSRNGFTQNVLCRGEDQPMVPASAAAFRQRG